MTDGERRLASIMFTDMVGYTALGQRNESLSLALVDEQRRLVRPILARHSGREVKTIGDAFLVEFPDALDSIRCAYDIQRATREFNVSLPTEQRIHLRVGLHLGDVVESGGDISGDAVNIASRVVPLAEDGGVCLTRQVYDQVENKFELSMVSLGRKSMKNVTEPIEVFKVTMPWEEPATQKEVTHAAPNRIAILPFVNFSPDPGDDYLANGMTEEIISTVSGISGLSVISRTSVMGYKGTTKKVNEIGSELNVGSVLEGSFRKSGDRIRVTAQLVDVAGDRHLWSQNYDRKLDDVFEVQSDVARQVAEALRVRILTPELERIGRRPTESTEAYSLYLKGRSLWNRRGLEDLKTASEYFRLSLREDPGFALGYAGLADCHLMLSVDWNLDSDTNLVGATEMVAKALALDPNMAEAHTTKGMLLLGECKLREAEEAMKKAIELKPSYATAHQWYMQVLVSQLRWDEAQREIEKAVELDPLSPIINDNLGKYFFWKRDFAKSIEPFRRAVELGLKGAHADLASSYGMMEMYEDMRREAAVYVEALQYTIPMVRLMSDAMIAYFEDGDRLRELLPEMEAHFQNLGMNAYWIAATHFHLGDKDKGFEWLERSYARKEGPVFVLIDPEFDEVRDDPRYLDFLRKIGLDSSGRPS